MQDVRSAQHCIYTPMLTASSNENGSSSARASPSYKEQVRSMLKTPESFRSKVYALTKFGYIFQVFLCHLLLVEHLTRNL